MIKSMTAFAHREVDIEAGRIGCELRSFNHRYLEVSVRTPEELRPLEASVRERISAIMKRGKIDCTLRFKPGAGIASQMNLNKPLINRLLKLGHEIDGMMFNPGRVTSMNVLRWPGALQESELNSEQLHAQTLTLVDEVLQEFNDTRVREGGRINEVITQRCFIMTNLIPPARQRIPEVLRVQREKLLSRLAEVRATLDSDRIEQELVLLAQKMDVEEELDRLSMHLAEVIRVLGQAEPVGRRLDFLMQELHREANTLGSKSADIEITRAAVDMKVLIEQIREQVQNVE